MNIIIKETGETKELLYVADYNREDAASDIIGNSGVTEAWEYDEERDMFAVPQKDADFWEKYLRETGEAAGDIAAAEREYRKAAGRNYPENKKLKVVSVSLMIMNSAVLRSPSVSSSISS